MKKILIIQTAFIGDVILSTAVIEKLRNRYPGAQIDFLLRKGNEDLLRNHPGINRLFVLDKGSGKWRNIVRMIRRLRQVQYDHLFNLQRFMTTGLISLFVRSREKSGFDKNPLSLFYHRKVPHRIGDGTHETERNNRLIEPLAGEGFVRPRLYPGPEDYEAVRGCKTEPYVCIAPASVWYTKQFPPERWLELLEQLPGRYRVYLIGGPDDHPLCEWIRQQVRRPGIENIAGSRNFLETAALMKDAVMNYVNDSAPLHIASAMNAPVRAVFCSTVPGFGFYPLSDDSKVVEIDYDLYCRPCGLHGYNACPEGHFRCAWDINIQKLLK
jgi:heptosyltransferase-2